MRLELHSTQQSHGESSNGHRSLIRGLRVLCEVLDAGGPVGVTEVANRTGLHKSTVSRLLVTLATEGYLGVDPVTGRYVSGRLVVARMRGGQVERVLQAQAVPLLEELRDASGETVALHVVCWPDRVCVLEVPSRSGIRRAHAPGETWPLTVGASGAACLAQLPPAEVQAALVARPVPPEGMAEFHRKLRGAQESGVAISADADHIEGMQGMAAPVVGPDGRPEAMVSVAGPTSRWTQEDMAAFVPRLKQAALSLSHFIGYQRDDFVTTRRSAASGAQEKT